MRLQDGTQAAAPLNRRLRFQTVSEWGWGRRAGYIMWMGGAAVRLGVGEQGESADAIREKKEKIQPCTPLPTPYPPDHLSPPLPTSLATSTCHPRWGTPGRKASPENSKS